MHLKKKKSALRGFAEQYTIKADYGYAQFRLWKYRTKNHCVFTK